MIKEEEEMEKKKRRWQWSRKGGDKYWEAEEQKRKMIQESNDGENKEEIKTICKEEKKDQRKRIKKEIL